MQCAGSRLDGLYLQAVPKHIQVCRKFEVVLFGAGADRLEQCGLRCWQLRPVAYGDPAQVTEAPFFSQRECLALVFGLFKACLEGLRVEGQLRGQRVHVAYAQLNELPALLRAFPVRVLPAPDGREPLGDVHLHRAGDQRGEVAVEFGGVEHRVIIAVLQQGVFDKGEVSGV